MDEKKKKNIKFLLEMGFVASLGFLVLIMLGLVIVHILRIDG